MSEMKYLSRPDPMDVPIAEELDGVASRFVVVSCCCSTSGVFVRYHRRMGISTVPLSVSTARVLLAEPGARACRAVQFTSPHIL
jgi:hypothetical protein